MKTWITILTGAMMVCALPVNAAAAPDYIAFTRKIDEVSAFLSVAYLCRAAGYTIPADKDAVEKAVPPLINQAIKDGIPEDMAYGMMSASLDAGVKNATALMTDHDTKLIAAIRANDETAMMAETDVFYKYIDGRCQEYAGSPKFSGLITAPESGGYSHFIRWEISRTEDTDTDTAD